MNEKELADIDLAYRDQLKKENAILREQNEIYYALAQRLIQIVEQLKQVNELEVKSKKEKLGWRPEG